jgi:Anti-sigma-K factor rskA
VNREPDFDALAEGASPEQRERLRRVHDLLVAAGPPPELPPALAEAPAERRERAPILTTLPRRRLGATLTAAIGLAAAAFGIGYLVGAGNEGAANAEFITVHVIEMKPTSNARAGAAAVLRLGKKEEGGNIPMLLAASGLDPVPEGGYYELWLTKKVGKRQIKEVSCGTFIASDRDLSVRMNAPYTLEPGFTGWIITRHVPGEKPDPTLFTT